MIAFPTILLLLQAEPVLPEPVGFGEFSLRVGIGATALVVFIGLCCVAWHTVPALKEIIPNFLESKSAARSDASPLKLKAKSNSVSSKGK